MDKRKLNDRKIKATNGKQTRTESAAKCRPGQILLICFSGKTQYLQFVFNGLPSSKAKYVADIVVIQVPFVIKKSGRIKGLRLGIPVRIMCNSPERKR